MEYKENVKIDALMKYEEINVESNNDQLIDLSFSDSANLISQNLLNPENSNKIQDLTELTKLIREYPIVLTSETMKCLFSLISTENPEINNLALCAIRRILKYPSKNHDFIFENNFQLMILDLVSQSNLHFFRICTNFATSSRLFRNFLLESNIFKIIKPFFDMGPEFLTSLAKFLPSFLDNSFDFETYGEQLAELFLLLVSHIKSADAKAGFYIVVAIRLFIRYDRNFLILFAEHLTFEDFFNFEASDTEYTQVLIELLTFIVRTSNEEEKHHFNEILWLSSQKVVQYISLQLKGGYSDVPKLSLRFLSYLIFIDPNEIESIYKYEIPSYLFQQLHKEEFDSLSPEMKIEIIHFFINLLSFATHPMFRQLQRIGIFDFLCDHLLDMPINDTFFALNIIKRTFNGNTKENNLISQSLAQKSELKEWLQILLDDDEEEQEEEIKHLSSEIWNLIFPKDQKKEDEKEEEEDSVDDIEDFI